MVGWANKHKDPEDMVLLYIWDCLGTNCDAMVAEALAAAGIRAISNCSGLSGMTVGEAVDLSELAGGGKSCYPTLVLP